MDKLPFYWTTHVIYLTSIEELETIHHSVKDFLRIIIDHSQIPLDHDPIMRFARDVARQQCDFIFPIILNDLCFTFFNDTRIIHSIFEYPFHIRHINDIAMLQPGNIVKKAILLVSFDAQ